MNSAVAALAATCYVSGGVPSGYLIAKRFRHIDIREHGSGNPGAANVYRVVGPAAGAATLAIDALKGFAPVLCARLVFPHEHSVWALCGVLAIVGHIWTVFLVFRGGKGVATSAGVFAALLPVPLFGAIAAFLLGLKLSGHIFIGSVAAALALPAAAWALGAPKPLLWLASAAAAMVIVRHVSNIVCLVRGVPLSVRKPAPAPGLEKTSETQ
ncbi:MAG TPA: acyl-phosphate--glycerol-3-phosphate O-acyltransferase [Elusimicrobia bacterium]|nr:acyl-phosphate--glycerol-3-phosphate O-acyltransferase [Elusimicrobiota bacterium]